MSLLPGDPVRRGAVLLAFLALSGLYFTRTYVYLPATEQAESTRRRLERLERENLGARAGEAMGEVELERRLALYQEHIGQLEELIPANEEVPELLEAISAEERKAGVEMTMMRPEPVEDLGFYHRLSYELAVRGDYHAVGSFIAAIASLERVVAPADLAIIPDGRFGSEGAADRGTVSASFRIRTYVTRAVQPSGANETPAANGAPTP